MSSPTSVITALNFLRSINSSIYTFSPHNPPLSRHGSITKEEPSYFFTLTLILMLLSWRTKDNHFSFSLLFKFWVGPPNAKRPAMFPFLAILKGYLITTFFRPIRCKVWCKHEPLMSTAASHPGAGRHLAVFTFWPHFLPRQSCGELNPEK